MDTPLYLKRDEKRKKVKIKQDIESTHKILREDIHDFLKETIENNKTKEESISELRAFLNSLTSESVKYRGNKNEGVERVISDIDSYGLIWKI